VAAFSTRDRVARAPLQSWKTLLGESRRNDGQLLPQDALIPGSTLLGYLNADHWAVVMELEEDLGFFAARRDRTPFPHEALIWQVSDDLGAQKP
jgi:hypothetical protein